VYRARGGSAGVAERRGDGDSIEDPRNYDAEHYVRVLRENFASRLARAFAPEDFAMLVADPDQGALFPVAFEEISAVLKEHS
jgi:hypothetical protein